MTATIRLDEELEKTLKKLSETLHQKKSEVIRSAIRHYANKIESQKKNRIAKAVKKTGERDLEVYRDFEAAIDDGI